MCIYFDIQVCYRYVNLQMSVLLRVVTDYHLIRIENEWLKKLYSVDMSQRYTYLSVWSTGEY